ncbi:MAG: HPF/RaiA family ribosome-associated protein, partial [Erysipelotrichaceae bacterium]|nr:HPF/RaiA family ribosome-associated protein [Erysipelotrichaceae bacterium]
MRFEIVGKNIEVSDAMKESIERKLSNLDKYLLINSDTIARVVARVYPDSEKVEVTIPTKVGILRAEV